jgi:hypothetical protein
MFLLAVCFAPPASLHQRDVTRTRDRHGAMATPERTLAAGVITVAAPRTLSGWGQLGDTVRNREQRVKRDPVIGSRCLARPVDVSANPR